MIIPILCGAVALARFWPAVGFLAAMAVDSPNTKAPLLTAAATFLGLASAVFGGGFLLGLVGERLFSVFCVYVVRIGQTASGVY